MINHIKYVRHLAAVVMTLALPGLFIAHASITTQRPIAPVSLPARSLTRLALDLNGDARPENVTLLSYGPSRTIQIQFANSPSRNVTFSSGSAFRGFLIPYDIDHDADLDLIWAAGADKNTFVIWINDGNANFRVAKNTAGYASEINALLNDTDPPDQQSLKLQRNDQRVNASSSAKIGLAVTCRFISPATYTSFLSLVDYFPAQPEFFTCPHKRGPPTILL